MKTYPKMIKVKQTFHAPHVENVIAETSDQLRLVLKRIQPGDKVAIAVGSRGIDNLTTVVSTIVQQIKCVGGFPFIVPAMGSHGGATDQGQEEVLASYGITLDNVGAPIRSSMDVIQLGTVDDGVPVYFDRMASEADAIVVVNRVKPHTNFKSDIESGLVKMMSVGLGKHKGASVIHSHGVSGLKNLIPKMGKLILEKMPIAFGVALVENAYDQTARIVAVEPEKWIETEQELLVEAKGLMASLPSDNIDVLLVEEMGKNISGTGMDTNIIGRMYVRGQEEPVSPNISYIGVLDLTTESHGNAIGIGYADLTTRRLVDKLDSHYTYTNVITAVFPQLAKIPITLGTDRELVEVSLQFMASKNPENVRLVRIRNTLDLGEIEVSEAIWQELKENPQFEALSELREIVFDEEGNMERL
jgi:hypothetical protein